MVLESLDSLIRACEERKESLVVEGVHLSLNAVVRLMRRHPSIVPFLIHISNEAKHRERFAVRSWAPLPPACSIGSAAAAPHTSTGPPVLPPAGCTPAPSSCLCLHGLHRESSMLVGMLHGA
jgi:hypothetical protein